MNGVWAVLLLALMPGTGNFLGGMIAEFGKSSPRLLNWALHGAAGVVIAIVAVELIPEALGNLPGWLLAAAFAAGGFTYMLLEWLLSRVQKDRAAGGRTGMWMIYAAVAVDLTSDGLMLGTGSAVSTSLAIVLAAGQMLADLPEGFAVIANFRSKGVPRKTRILLAASYFFYVIGAALLSYMFLRNAGEAVKFSALVFVGGVLTVAAVEDMLEEAHAAREDNRRSVAAFIVGFALFTLASAGLESVIGGSNSR